MITFIHKEQPLVVWWWALGVRRAGVVSDDRSVRLARLCARALTKSELIYSASDIIGWRAKSGARTGTSRDRWTVSGFFNHSPDEWYAILAFRLFCMDRWCNVIEHGTSDAYVRTTLFWLDHYIDCNLPIASSMIYSGTIIY